VPLIFKELENELKHVNSELKSNFDNTFYDAEEKEILEFKKEVLEELNSFMLSFNWLTHKKSKDKIAAFLRSKYNYERVREDFGIRTIQSLQVSVSRASKLLANKIGKPLDLIKQGKTEEALSCFRGICTEADAGLAEESRPVVETSPLMVSSHLDNLPYKKNTSLFSIADCKRELKFMRIYSLSMFRLYFDTLDKDKLAFLRYVAESEDSRFDYEREQMLNLINGVTKDVDATLTAIESVAVLKGKVRKRK
jgi:hypothetical protein